MSNLRVEQSQSQVTQQQTKAQPKQKENIVIEFTDLPKELKTKKVRDFYDKDNNGLIETTNTQNQNEYADFADFAKSLGIDLSQYKSNIAKTKKVTVNREGKREVTRAYDKSEKWLKDIEIMGDGDIATYEGQISQTKFSKFYKGDTLRLKLEQKTINSQRGIVEGIYYQEDGSVVKWFNVGKQNEQRIMLDADGNTIAIDNIDPKTSQATTQTRYKTTKIVDGKNTLMLKEEYVGKSNDSDIISIGYGIQEQGLNNIPENFKLKSTTYTLNGQQVQAKPLSKGRYEITDKDGNISYISHDGIKLKPEYVRNNP